MDPDQTAPLIWVHTVCLYAKIGLKSLQEYSADDINRRHFQMQFFLALWGLKMLWHLTYAVQAQDLISRSICRPRWLSWMGVWLETRRSGFDPCWGRQHSFAEIDHEIFSTVILSLPLIQEGQLSVSGEKMCTILVNHFEDYACLVNVWLGKLTMLDMTPLGWLGHKTSTQTNK